MPALSFEKSFIEAADKVIPPIGGLFEVLQKGFTTRSETLWAMLRVLEREGVATSNTRFGGTSEDGIGESHINIKVFANGEVLASTPESWGATDGRPHGFHARIHPGEHEVAGGEIERREGCVTGSPPISNPPSPTKTPKRKGR